MAANLLDSLDDAPIEDPEEVRGAWATEVEQRARRAISGEDPGRPWADVRERIHSELAR